MILRIFFIIIISSVYLQAQDENEQNFVQGGDKDESIWGVRSGFNFGGMEGLLQSSETGREITQVPSLSYHIGGYRRQKNDFLSAYLELGLDITYISSISSLRFVPDSEKEDVFEEGAIEGIKNEYLRIDLPILMRKKTYQFGKYNYLHFYGGPLLSFNFMNTSNFNEKKSNIIQMGYEKDIGLNTLPFQVASIGALFAVGFTTEYVEIDFRYNYYVNKFGTKFEISQTGLNKSVIIENLKIGSQANQISVSVSYLFK